MMFINSEDFYSLSMDVWGMHKLQLIVPS